MCPSATLFALPRNPSPYHLLISCPLHCFRCVVLLALLCSVSLRIPCFGPRMRSATAVRPVFTACMVTAGPRVKRGRTRRVGAPAHTQRFSRSGCPLPSPQLPIPCHFQSLACPAHAGSRAVDAAALWPPARNHRWANLHVRGLHRPRQSMTYFANFSAW